MVHEEGKPSTLTSGEKLWCPSQLTRPSMKRLDANLIYHSMSCCCRSKAVFLFCRNPTVSVEPLGSTCTLTLHLHLNVRLLMFENHFPEFITASFTVGETSRGSVAPQSHMTPSSRWCGCTCKLKDVLLIQSGKLFCCCLLASPCFHSCWCSVVIEEEQALITFIHSVKKTENTPPSQRWWVEEPRSYSSVFICGCRKTSVLLHQTSLREKVTLPEEFSHFPVVLKSVDSSAARQEAVLSFLLLPLLRFHYQTGTLKRGRSPWTWRTWGDMWADVSLLFTLQRQADSGIGTDETLKTEALKMMKTAGPHEWMEGRCEEERSLVLVSVVTGRCQPWSGSSCARVFLRLGQCLCPSIHPEG